MSQKMVFTVPTINDAANAVSSLRAMGLTEDDISVMGDQTVELDSLPEAGEYENDAVPGAIRGAGFGGATGLLAGLGAALVAPGIVVGGAALALAAAGGATFGVLASTLIGSSLPNSQLRDYEEALERGEILLVAAVEEDRAAEIKATLDKEHSNMKLVGEVDVVPPVV